MVKAKPIKLAMSQGEQTICLEKRCITRYSLIQQIDSLQQSRSRSTAKPCQKKIIGARIKIESRNVARRGAFDCVLFTWRKLGLKLLGNRLCNFALNGKNGRQIAVIIFSPSSSVVARIEQSRVDADALARALNAPLHYMRDAKLLANLAQVAGGAALILHHCCG